jgi:hypothetical protein
MGGWYSPFLAFLVFEIKKVMVHLEVIATIGREIGEVEDQL